MSDKYPPSVFIHCTADEIVLLEESSFQLDQLSALGGEVGVAAG